MRKQSVIATVGSLVVSFIPLSASAFDSDGMVLPGSLCTGRTDYDRAAIENHWHHLRNPSPDLVGVTCPIVREVQQFDVMDVRVSLAVDDKSASYNFDCWMNICSWDNCSHTNAKTTRSQGRTLFSLQGVTRSKLDSITVDCAVPPGSDLYHLTTRLE